MTTVRLQVPVADVRDGDTVTDVTPRPNPERGFLPRRVVVNPVGWPARGTTTIAGTYLINGQDAGTGVWTWPADATATIERETTP